MQGYFEAAHIEDIPDELIWGNPKRLEEWFAAVEQRRKDGYEPVPEADEEDGMTGNELARELIGE